MRGFVAALASEREIEAVFPGWVAAAAAAAVRKIAGVAARRCAYDARSEAVIKLLPMVVVFGVAIDADLVARLAGARGACWVVGAGEGRAAQVAESAVPFHGNREERVGFVCYPLHGSRCLRDGDGEGDRLRLGDEGR